MDYRRPQETGESSSSSRPKSSNEKLDRHRRDMHQMDERREICANTNYTDNKNEHNIETKKDILKKYGVNQDKTEEVIDLIEKLHKGAYCAKRQVIPEIISKYGNNAPDIIIRGLTHIDREVSSGIKYCLKEYGVQDDKISQVSELLKDSSEPPEKRRRIEIDSPDAHNQADVPISSHYEAVKHQPESVLTYRTVTDSSDSQIYTSVDALDNTMVNKGKARATYNDYQMIEDSKQEEWNDRLQEISNPNFPSQADQAGPADKPPRLLDSPGDTTHSLGSTETQDAFRERINQGRPGKQQLTANDLSRLLNGISKTSKGWTLNENDPGKAIPADKPPRLLDSPGDTTHPLGSKETRDAFRERINQGRPEEEHLTKSILNNLLSKVTKTSRGWTLNENDPGNSIPADKSSRLLDSPGDTTHPLGSTETRDIFRERINQGRPKEEHLTKSDLSNLLDGMSKTAKGWTLNKNDPRWRP